jgi:hypothetical protein
MMNFIKGLFLLVTLSTSAMALTGYTLPWQIRLTGDTATVVKWKNNDTTHQNWATRAADTITNKIPRFPQLFRNHDSTFSWMNIDTISGQTKFDTLLGGKRVVVDSVIGAVRGEVLGNATTSTTAGTVTTAAQPTITSVGTLTGLTTASANISGLTASRAVFTDGSKNLASNTITGTGNVVMSASPTLTGTVGAASIQATGDLRSQTLIAAYECRADSIGPNTLSDLTVFGYYSIACDTGTCVTTQTQKNFPTGYTKDNCIVLSCMIKYNNNAWINFESMAALVGTPAYIDLQAGTQYALNHNTGLNGWKYRIVFLRNNLLFK